MGWDNASTVAQEVENPQRNYPRAMIAATASGRRHLHSAAGCHGGGRAFTGQLLHRRLDHRARIDRRASARRSRRCRRRHHRHRHVQCARDELHAPAHGHGRRRHAAPVVARRNSRGVPWVSVLLCGLAWALALKLPFERLISIDLILYGSSLLLEFVALVVLRIREPKLERPFKAGNLAFACLLGVGPPRSSVTRSMLRATKSSSAPPPRCCLPSASAFSVRCSTGLPPLPWPAAASPQSPSTAIELACRKNSAAAAGRVRARVHSRR